MKYFKNRGFGLIEIIVYVSIVALIAIFSINAILSVTKVFAEVKSYNDLRESAVISLERMIKEIRFANDIDIAGTVFGTNPGRLKLNTTDETGSPKTLEFYVSGGSLNIIDNDAEKGTITGSSTALTNLVFRQALTPKGKLIKIEMTLSDTRANPRTVNFYGSAVLRGSY